MSGFWDDESRLSLLKEFLVSIIDETAPTGTQHYCLLVFVALIHRNRSVCIQIFDGKTHESKFRYCEIPQRTDAETWASKNHNLSLSYILNPVKKSLADLVDMLLTNKVKFRRMTVRLERQKKRIFKVFRHKPHAYSVHHEGRVWGHRLQVDPGMRNEVFESYVEWLEGGGEAEPPPKEWDGSLVVGKPRSLR